MPHEPAPAKLNLVLHVRGRRGDGYHDIESLFAFCADGDRVAATPRDDGRVTLTIDGPFAAGLDAGDGNLVLRAAHALLPHAGGQGADLTLTKNLPVASGIGGGSADAAATLRLLIRLWGLRPMDIDLPAIAASLGADVPACLASRTLLATGIGERLAPVDLDLTGTPVLLANPMVACPTGPVFARWDGVDRGPLDIAAWRGGRNDLTGPASAQVPEISAVLGALEAQPGADVVRMSGSGATCFALFGDVAARDAAAAALATRWPHWWLLASVLT